MLSSKLILISALLISIELVRINEAAATEKPTKDTRIVGGTSTTIAAVPYLVNLRINGRFTCGGTLVKAKYVVTAAHCVQGVSKGSLMVYGGSGRLSGGGQKRAVAKITVNKSYRSSTLSNDVAVLKLKKPMTGPNIKPIALTSKPIKSRTSLKVSGWGLRRETASQVSDIVQTVNVPVIKKSSCTRSYRGYATISGSMFCGSVPGRKDACSGDSGGPAICNNRLCGIVSWGIGCASNKFPGVYTDVYAVRKFIKSAMK